MTTRARQRHVDIPARCRYAAEPGRRPDCTLTAVVRYGDIALCTSCQQRRSTVGKAEYPIPLPPGPTVDVLQWVGAAARDAAAAAAVLAAAVARARRAGHSWSVIGSQLGVTRQAAQQRFTRSRAFSDESTKRRSRAP